jgi:choline dehydrogenase-like flavoprotein
VAERFDVCVIGSGFGGSISAYYLAKAGQRVVVLERGPRRSTESLQVPLRSRDLLELTHTFNGNGITILVGSAVGGGSLVYSGVSLRAPSFVFERQEGGLRVWPREISRRSLVPYYRRAEIGLGVHRLGFDEVAKRGGIWGKRMNRLGYRVDRIRQATTACVHCGFCNTGCKFFRKNHLTLNYLLGAERAGAEVRPLREAVTVQPADGGYRIAHGPTDTSPLGALAPSPDEEIQADRVILAGGAIGTPGLLLRSQRYLENLSPEVGKHLSANGDLALMATLPRSRRLPGRGLVKQHQGVAMDTICYEFLESDGIVIITQHELSLATLVNGDPDGQWWGLKKKRLMRRYGDQMLGLAVLGVDGSPGTLSARVGGGDEVRLTPAFGISDIDFPIDPETRRVFDNGRRIVGDLVRRMGGTPIDLTFNPSPTHDETAFSAHPLGTARMADSPDLGVVNADGEVFGHPGLYVADGAAVPTALGVNPSLTIAALAERVATGLVRKLGHEPARPPLSNPYVRRRPHESGAGLKPRRRRRRRARGRRDPARRGSPRFTG